MLKTRVATSLKKTLFQNNARQEWHIREELIDMRDLGQTTFKNEVSMFLHINKIMTIERFVIGRGKKTSPRLFPNDPRKFEFCLG